MTNQPNSPTGFMGVSPFFLLFFLVLIIYSNTFHASWHFDDYQNIVQDSNIHITNLSIPSLINSFYLAETEFINRPLSRLTFALNWYAGKDNVAGYHVVNMLIHFLTAFILFKTVLILLNSPRTKGMYQGSEFFIAMLASVFWAANPIQTQAVTYIVQRMASIATLFYLLSLFFYVTARITKTNISFLFCIISAGLSLASKENAATLPLALLIVEAVFFQNLALPKTRNVFVLMFVFSGLIVVTGVILLFWGGNFKGLLGGYDDRLFSPAQRLMTEPRVLVYYISQIFYPVPTRLSIEHDFDVSTSFLTPWTTLPCIIIIIILIVFGFWRMKKNPLLSFAILFFFLNHVVESSIIGLELVFEHRNYLPSLFVFLPVAVAIKFMLDYYKENRMMRNLFVCFIILLIMGFGMGTYIRNMAWATEKTLWSDAGRKAPGQQRPLHNLAFHYYEKIKQYDVAMELYTKALKLKPHRKSHWASVYNNMANIYFMKGYYSKAAELFKKAYELYPATTKYQFRVALSLAKSGESEKALQYIDPGILACQDCVNTCQDCFNFLNLKGYILLVQGKPREALMYFKQCVKLHPHKPDGLIPAGVALALINKHYNAEYLFKRAHALDPDNMLTVIRLIDINIKIRDDEDVGYYINALLSSATLTELSEKVNVISSEKSIPPGFYDGLIKLLTEKIKKEAEIISKKIDHPFGA